MFIMANLLTFYLELAVTIDIMVDLLSYINQENYPN